MNIVWPRNDDRSLLRRIQQRDDKALASLYDRYAGIVYSIALRVLRDPAPAEQVLSDIFLGIWHEPHRWMQIPRGLSFPMVMMARNRALTILLRKPVADPDFSSPHWTANHHEPNVTREQACAALDKFPPERRLLLETLFFQGSTKQALSALTASPHDTDEQPATSIAVARLAGTGLEVIDLQSDPSFARRQLHVRDVVAHIEGMNRLARVFVENPNRILQQLANAAVELCGADSAGISIEQKDGPADSFYHWAATAGQYSGFLNARLPRYPSACGVTIERQRPQIFRVSQRFFDVMGIKAPVVTDGLLLPWQAEETRGTIWIMAHGRDEAFDNEDCRMMQALANFAATGVRLQQQQALLMEQATTAAQAALANKLAHQINNPLQGLMQTVFLFGRDGTESGLVAQQAMWDVLRLSDLVKRLLSFPEHTRPTTAIQK